MPVWLISIIIGVVINVIAYLIMPKPKKTKPAPAKDMDNPTAEAGRPIPVVFGSITVKGLNVLWYGDKRVAEYQVRA